MVFCRMPLELAVFEVLLITNWRSGFSERLPQRYGAPLIPYLWVCDIHMLSLVMSTNLPKCAQVISVQLSELS